MMLKSFVAACITLALVACGSPFVARPFAPSLALRQAQGDTWALRQAQDALRQAQDDTALLYVSDTGTSDVYVYSYPAGVLKQTLTGFTDPGGECVDAKGDVFVTNTGGSDVLEYAHGASNPSATLKDAGEFPIGCAVDPSTGNLAVTNFSSSSSGPGNIVIYKDAKGSIVHRLSSPALNAPLLCGYNETGDLFVDGQSHSSVAAYAEVLHGSTKLRSVTLDTSINMPGGVQWVGNDVVVGDQAFNVLYRFSIAGEKGTKAASTTLKGGSEIFQFFIDGSRVVGPNSGQGTVGIWKYPAGGAALKSITGLNAPLGAAVSN